MSAISPGVIDTNQVKTAYLTLSLIHTAATYTFGTVSGADVYLLDLGFICTVNAAGFVTMTVQLDDGSATALLASIAVASVLTTTALVSLLTAPKVVLSGRHLQTTLVGTNGTAGTILVACRYMPLATGGLIS